jgi:CheY-like chemotaxis protein
MHQHPRGLRSDCRKLRDKAYAGLAASPHNARQRLSTMAQRIYIKVVGFSDDERHALNTLFRLSEQCQTMYQLWSEEATEPAKMALLDAQSWEARVEAVAPSNHGVKLVWVGDDPPPQVWRSFRRPIVWTEIVEAMDALFLPDRAIDFDLGFDDGAVAPPAEEMSRKRALIVSASRDERLYLRARLSLAALTQADDADSGSNAVELARGQQYDLAVVDFGLKDMNAWVLLRQLRQGRRPIKHVAMTNAPRSVPEHVRAWLTGAEALLGKPPHPARLHAWLKSVD